MLASLTRRPTCRTALPLRPARGDAPWRCFPPGFMSRLMSWHSVAEAGVRGWSRCAFYRMASKEWHAGMNESSWAIIVRLSAGWRRVLAAHTPGVASCSFCFPFLFSRISSSRYISIRASNLAQSAHTRTHTRFLRALLCVR